MVCVNSVNVSPSNKTIRIGEWYYGATATVSPTTATCKDVTWSSSNPDVASVNASSGAIYGLLPGTAKIYATAQDGSEKSDYCTVIVSRYISVTSVSLDKTKLSIENGDCYTLTATVCPENASNRSLTWTSDDEDIATVSDGVITARGKGTTVIRAIATDGTGKSASCTVTVTGDMLVSSVTVSPSSKTMTVGDTDYLYETVCPEIAANKCVTWSSDDLSVATVNPESGLVCAQTAGTTAIRATAQDGSGVAGICNLTVIDPICVEDITLNCTSLTICKGNTYRLVGTVCPADATTKTIRWSSSKTSVATVNECTGLVTAKKAGRAFVYATAQDGSGVTSCCEIVVKQTVVCCAEETPVNKVAGSTVADPVDVYTGAHLLNNTVMSLFGGQGIKFVAHYNSTYLAYGLLGSGWYHNYEKHITIDGCEAFVYSNPSIFSRYTAENDDCTRFICCSANKNGYVLTIDQAQEYPYIIDCNSMRTEYYNANGNLAKIVDHQGFETLIAYSDLQITITDGVSGKKIYLEKDSSCKVVRVYDDAGREAVLTYSDNLLTSICDVNGNTLSYAYDGDGRVKSGTDSKGICYFENTYDELGRVIEQKDAIPGSIKSIFVYDDDIRTTTDRNGKQSVREYDCNGLLIKHTDENGNIKTYEYDERDNVIKETDAKGNAVIKVYNNFNKPTEITDRNGNKTYFTYDAVGNVTKVCYPAIEGAIPEELFVYNSRNQMMQHTDIRGTVTVYTYDANGMPATKKVGSKNAIVYSYEEGLLKAQTDAMGNTTRYSHNSIGQVISKTDADNKVTQYTYDNSGNLLCTVDANGKSIVTAYDCNYQKISVTDANGNKTEYSYNGNMKNDVVTLPDGHMVRYEFDGEDRPVKVIDQANNATNIIYDNAGRVISKRFADGAIVQYEYDAAGNVVKETNPKGAVTIKTHDNLGNVLTATDNDGNMTLYEYNAMSKVVKVTNAVAGTTVYVYSKSGDLLSETDALGNTKTYTYDAFGNRLTATDAKNNVTTYTYDQNNNLLTVKDALNHVTAYTYNALNQCVSVKDALNNIIRYGYDALGRRTTITDARGNVFTNIYDGNGNVIKTTDAKGNIISETVYNCLNQPLTVTDAMGKETTYTYNALGKVESVTDPLNHRTELAYNSRGQNTSVRDAANNTSTSTYDLLGNVTCLAGPLGGATNYTYDDMGRLISESTVSGGTKSYEYNELNIRKKLTNARGQIRQFFYDAMGRITGYTSPEGSVSYTYDANGNVLTVTDSHGTITRTYDALNHVSSYTDTYGKVIRYGYDAVGNLSKIIYPDNTAVTYTYDANHNLVRVTDWANRVTAYTYDVNNRVVGVTKPDGSVTTTVYDNKQRITSTVERTSGGVMITGFEYTYDDLDRICEEIHVAENIKICYAYDNLSRVTARTIINLADNSQEQESYNYDAAGNITDATGSCFQYDTNNRLVVFSGNSVSYDMDGNMLNNGETSFTYDSANRLVTAGGHTYTYNAEDVRIRNLCADEDSTYTYDTNCKLSKLLCRTINDVTTKYVYGRSLIGEEVGGAFKTYHFDCRGSTIAITDESGNITDTFAYDTYGKQISRTGTSAVIFGYNGRDGVVTDANGLIYMRARYYSPDMKRFVNADIVAGQISNAVTLNRFAYANGNPVSFVDPLGLSVERGNSNSSELSPTIQLQLQKFLDEYYAGKTTAETLVDEDILEAFYRYMRNAVLNEPRPNNIGKGVWNKQVDADLKWVDDVLGANSKLAKTVDILGKVGIVIDVGVGVYENIQSGTDAQRIVTDAMVDTGVSIGGGLLASAAGSAAAGAVAGSVAPGVGNLIGAGVGFLAGVGIYLVTEVVEINGKSAVDWVKEGVDWFADGIAGWFK